MFEWLFCKHKYKMYNIKDDHGYSVYQFICTKCKKEINISVSEIKNMISKFQSDYNNSLILGGRPIKSSEMIVNYNDTNVVYSSPAVTLMFEYYKNKGIDLTQINQYYKNKNYPHAEG